LFPACENFPETNIGRGAFELSTLTTTQLRSLEHLGP